MSFKEKKIVACPKNQWITVKNTHEAIFNEALFGELEVQRRKNRRGEKCSH